MVMVSAVLPVCGCLDKYSRVKPESGELLVVEEGSVREAKDGHFPQPTLEFALSVLAQTLGCNLSLTAVRLDMCLTDGWRCAALGWVGTA